MNIGSIIPFGNYQWRILDIKESKMLIITDQIIEQRDYHDKKESITWEHSEIRSYLNTTFFDRFASSEKERILTTLNKNAEKEPLFLWIRIGGGHELLEKITRHL